MRRICNLHVHMIIDNFSDTNEIRLLMAHCLFQVSEIIYALSQ